LASPIERFRATLPRASDHLQALIQHSLDIARKYCQIIGIGSSGSALLEGMAAWVPQAPDPSNLSPEQTSADGTQRPRSARDSPGTPQPVAENWRGSSYTDRAQSIRNAPMD